MYCKYLLPLCVLLSTLLKKWTYFSAPLMFRFKDHMSVIQETFLNLADHTLSHSCLSVLPELGDEKDVSASMAAGACPGTACSPCPLEASHPESHSHRIRRAWSKLSGQFDQRIYILGSSEFQHPFHVRFGADKGD